MLLSDWSRDMQKRERTFFLFFFFLFDDAYLRIHFFFFFSGWFLFFFSSSSSIYAIASLSFFGLSRLIKSHIRRAIQRELRDGAIPSRKLLLLLLLTEWLGKHKQKPLPTERNKNLFFGLLVFCRDRLLFLTSSSSRPTRIIISVKHADGSQFFEDRSKVVESKKTIKNNKQK